MEKPDTATIELAEQYCKAVDDESGFTMAKFGSPLLICLGAFGLTFALMVTDVEDSWIAGVMAVLAIVVGVLMGIGAWLESRSDETRQRRDLIERYKDRDNEFTRIVKGPPPKDDGRRTHSYRRGL